MLRLLDPKRGIRRDAALTTQDGSETTVRHADRLGACSVT